LSGLKKATVNKELELQKLQLYWLLQITKAINYNLPESNLYEIYKNVAKDHLKIGRLSLISKEDVWNEKVNFGLSIAIDNQEIDEIVQQATIFDNIAEDLPRWMTQFDTIIPVLHNDKPLAYAFVGGIKDSVFEDKREASSFLHTITNVIAVAVENKRLVQESLNQAAVTRELELAAEMQTMLFPADLNLHGFMDVAATYIPHQQIGGDYYDLIHLNDDEAIVCMADVSGKGVSAALLMSNFQANLHALVNNGNNLTEIAIKLNDCVNKSAKGEKFITFFIAKVNKITREIHYINAGHHPPVLVNDNNVKILDAGTTGLGMFDEFPFLNTGTVHFPAGSILFLYTDGITEMENSSGIALGEERLIALIESNLGIGSMQDLHYKMIEEFNEYKEEVEYSDDVTFLSCRFLF
jgi:phosphoserine phosphatase RsbU/P